MPVDTARKPPWKAYSYPWGSMGWRMGGGEDFWHDFCDWFRSLDDESRAAYSLAHPEPPDWKYFYEYITTNNDNRKRLDELHALIAASQTNYQAEEYQRGRSAEDAGDISQAVTHYRNVIHHGDFQDATERYDRLRSEDA